MSRPAGSKRPPPTLVALWIASSFVATSCRRPAPDPQAQRPTDVAPARPVSFATSDGGLVHADEYGTGERGVVLAHGGRFDKASWSAQAAVLARAGFHVLAIDFRGFGMSKVEGQSEEFLQHLELDVLAAVAHLRANGARSVSVVGGSMGGWAAATAAAIAEPGEPPSSASIDRLVLLAPSPVDHPERVAGRKLYVIARDDPNANGTLRLVRLREQYEQVPEPKELLILEGAAHAQFLFTTDQGERAMNEIVRFLSAP